MAVLLIVSNTMSRWGKTAGLLSSCLVPRRKNCHEKDAEGGFVCITGHISAVFVDRFTRRREESLEFILARHGREYKYLCAIILPLLLSFGLSQQQREEMTNGSQCFHCWHHAANTSPQIR